MVVINLEPEAVTGQNILVADAGVLYFVTTGGGEP